MIGYLAAEATSNSPDVMSTILQWGPAGVVLALLLSGLLVTKGSHEDVKTERARWQEAYEKERQAHELTRAALSDANNSAAAAVETAKTTAALLQNLGHPTRRSGTDAA